MHLPKRFFRWLLALYVLQLLDLLLQRLHFSPPRFKLLSFLAYIIRFLFGPLERNAAREQLMSDTACLRLHVAMHRKFSLVDMIDCPPCRL